MTVNEGLRLMAGSFVLVSLAPGFFVDPAWLLLGVFVGLKLVQSAFTHACPAMWMLRKAGLRDDAAR